MGGLGRADEYGYAVPLGYSAPGIAFEELLNRHGPDLHRFVARRVSDPGLVDDIVQDTLLRAYRSRHVFDRRRPVWPWLATIAKNTISNALRGERSRRRHVERDLDWRAVEGYADLQFGGDPERRYASKEQRAAIVQALEALDDRQRRLLLMRAAEGLGYEEIARMEGLSLDAVKSLLKRARRSFRDAYDRLGPEEDVSGAAWPFLTHARASFRVHFSRLRTRAEYAANAVRCPGGMDSLIQILGAASVAGVILLGGLATKPVPAAPTADPHHAVGSGLESSGRAANTPAPAEPSGSQLLHESIGAGSKATRTQVSVIGSLDKGRPERRSMRVGVEYRAPGMDQGIGTWVDVPCGIGNVRGPYCDLVDGLPPPGDHSP